MSSPIAGIQEVRGELAYVWAFKNRAKEHHCLGYGTGSLDVGALESLRREYSRRVRPITYLPIYIKALGLALASVPEGNAILFKSLFGRRIVRFKDVDVNFPVIRELDGRPIIFIATIRNAPNKSLAQIQDELIEVQRCPPERSAAIQRILKFSKMPFWLARLVHWWMTWSPSFYIKNVGSCGLTLMDGHSFERFLPIAPTSIVFCPGGVKNEAVVRGKEIASRRMMKTTLMVDNFVISGPIGARIGDALSGLLESGSFIQAEIAAAQPTPIAKVRPKSQEEVANGSASG